MEDINPEEYLSNIVEILPACSDIDDVIDNDIVSFDRALDHIHLIPSELASRFLKEVVCYVQSLVKCAPKEQIGPENKISTLKLLNRFLSMYIKDLKEFPNQIYCDAIMMILDPTNEVFQYNLKPWSVIIHECIHFRYVKPHENDQSFLALCLLEHFIGEGGFEALFHFVDKYDSVDNVNRLMRLAEVWRINIKDELKNQWTLHISRIWERILYRGYDLDFITSYKLFGDHDIDSLNIYEACTKCLLSEDKALVECGISLLSAMSNQRIQARIPISLDLLLEIVLTSNLNRKSLLETLFSSRSLNIESLHNLASDCKLCPTGLEVIIDLTASNRKFHNRLNQFYNDSIRERRVKFSIQTLALAKASGIHQRMLLQWCFDAILEDNTNSQSAMDFILANPSNWTTISRIIDIFYLNTLEPSVLSKVITIVSKIGKIEKLQKMQPKLVLTSLKSLDQHCEGEILIESIRNHLSLLESYQRRKSPMSGNQFKQLVDMMSNSKHNAQIFYDFFEKVIGYALVGEEILKDIFMCFINLNTNNRLLKLIADTYIMININNKCIHPIEDRISSRKFPMFIVVKPIDFEMLKTFAKKSIQSTDSEYFDYSIDTIVSILLLENDNSPSPDYLYLKEEQFIKFAHDIGFFSIEKTGASKLLKRFVDTRMDYWLLNLGLSNVPKMSSVECIAEAFSVSHSTAFYALLGVNMDEYSVSETIRSEVTAIESTLSSLIPTLSDKFVDTFKSYLYKPISGQNLLVSDSLSENKGDILNKGTSTKQELELYLKAIMEFADTTQIVKQIGDINCLQREIDDIQYDTMCFLMEYLVVCDKSNLEPVEFGISLLDNFFTNQKHCKAALTDKERSYQLFIYNSFMVENPYYTNRICEHVQHVCLKHECGRDIFSMIFNIDSRYYSDQFLSCFEYVSSHLDDFWSPELVEIWVNSILSKEDIVSQLYQLRITISILKTSGVDYAINLNLIKEFYEICIESVFKCNGLNLDLKNTAFICLIELTKIQPDIELMKIFLKHTMEIEIIKNPNSLLDDPKIPTKQKSFTPGLKNLGTTCYLNSLLQYLFSSSEFYTGLLYMPYSQESQKKRLLYELKKLFVQMKYSTMQYLDTKDLVRSLSLNVNVQSDIDEFYSTLRDKLDFAANSSTDLFKELFGGSLNQSIVCSMNEKHVVKSEETFYSLSLDVKDVSSLESSMDRFFSTEEIQGFHCDDCKMNVDVSKTYSIKCLPRTLVVHLKRIGFDPLKGHTKYNNRLSFPFEMDIKRYCSADDSKNLKYILDGIIVHNGNENHGHYYIILKQDDMWVKYDDVSVYFFAEENMKKECFGGSRDLQFDVLGDIDLDSLEQLSENSMSAYMLMYRSIDYKPLSFTQKNDDTNIEEWIKDIESENETITQHNFLHSDVYLESMMNAIEVFIDLNYLESDLLAKILPLLMNVAFEKILKLNKEDLFEKCCQIILKLCKEDIVNSKYIVWVLSDQKQTWLSNALIKTASTRIKNQTLGMLVHCLEPALASGTTTKPSRKLQISMPPKNLSSLKTVELLYSSLLYVFDYLKDRNFSHIYLLLIQILSVHKKSLPSPRPLVTKLIEHYWKRQANAHQANNNIHFVNEQSNLVDLLFQGFDSEDLVAYESMQIYKLLSSCIENMYNINTVKKIADRLFRYTKDTLFEDLVEEIEFI